MAAASTGISSVSSTTHTTSFVISSDPPAKLVLSEKQLFNCSKAVKSLKEKTQSPDDTIEQDFGRIEAKALTKAAWTPICSEALRDINRPKNRYENVVPFDENRVVLESSEVTGSPGNDYINASFVEVGSSECVSRFIATQGPLPETYEDFWKMVIQYHCPVIMMLTRLFDNDEDDIKCGDYFQSEEDSPREFGDIQVTTKWTKTTDTSLVLRCLEVKYKQSEESVHSVLHIQYPDWPDQGVPSGTLATREIAKRMYHIPPAVGPLVVHCSAGIGRTGTFCTILNTIQRILNGNMTDLDLGETVSIFRSQRIGMVQQKEQFFFCYNAVADELEDLISHSKSIAGNNQY